MVGKQVTELDELPSFTDTSLLPVHNGAGLKKGLLSQLANYLGTKFSNPNLLINPDFKINQRGKSTYTAEGVMYTVDRWKAWRITVNIDENGYINIANNAYQDEGILRQQLESAIDGPSTLSCYVESVSGTVKMEEPNSNSKIILKQGLNILHVDGNADSFKITLVRGSNVTLKWAKLEQGKVATAFIAPNMAEEITKCKRYFQVLNVFEGFVGSVSYWNLYTKFYVGAMRTTSPTITANVSSATINLSGDNTDRKLQLSNNISPTMYLNELIITHKSATNFGYNAFTACIFRSAITYNVDAEIY
jgi:hypothetical protein